jgi:hypothetical protein
MKRFAIALLLAAFSCSAAAEWTGLDWNGWTAERKARFLEGFVAGSQWVASNSMAPFLIPDENVREYAKRLWEQSTAEYSQAIRNPKDKLPPKYSAGDVMLIGMYDGYKKNPLFERAIITNPVQQVSDRLDSIFRDPMNRKIPLSYAIYLAKKIIGGLVSEDINVLLPYLRGEKPVPLGWIIPVYDSKGKFVKVIEFP